MYPCDRETLTQLLTLIDRGECKLALQTWSQYRHKVTQTCNHCPYKTIDQHEDCCMCLESKLRTLSLYQHGEDKFDQILLNAARKLEQFNASSRGIA